jgi:hypothetical protein
MEENYHFSIINNKGELIFPTFMKFMKKFEEGFKPTNRD